MTKRERKKLEEEFDCLLGDLTEDRLVEDVGLEDMIEKAVQWSRLAQLHMLLGFVDGPPR